ncbi:hypothetical protein, partial [Pseudomonas viridiflava]|uniref:hypothetical protein n=1 Tax=Pseudomonas viridiflava TaxID=33069 RepID=UPI00197D3980
PVHVPGDELPIAIVVMGASSRLPMNDSYRVFYSLLRATLQPVMPTPVPTRRNANVSKHWRRWTRPRSTSFPMSATNSEPR